MLITIIVIIALSILILGHEFGHFITAKMFGMKVDEFGLGFPPRMFGWVKYSNKDGSVKKRKFFWGTKEPAEEMTLSTISGQTVLKRADTIYSMNWLIFGGFVRIAGENDRIEGDLGKYDSLPEKEKNKIFFAQPAWRRSIVMLAGVTMNFLLGWLLISFIFLKGTAPSLIVYQVQPGSPAAQAGMAPGDIIKNYRTAEDFISYVSKHKGEEIEIDVKRGNEAKEFKLTPRINTTPDQGAVGVVFVGIVGRGPVSAVRDGAVATWDTTIATIQGFYSLLKSLVLHARFPEGVVGPVGIFSIAQDAGQLGLIYLFQLFALISINLAVINLVPFPALDGGRFLFILIEKIKGSPIPRKAEAWINGLGFILLILLMLGITLRDIIRL